MRCFSLETFFGGKLSSACERGSLVADDLRSYRFAGLTVSRGCRLIARHSSSSRDAAPCPAVAGRKRTEMLGISTRRD